MIVVRGPLVPDHALGTGGRTWLLKSSSNVTALWCTWRSLLVAMLLHLEERLSLARVG